MNTRSNHQLIQREQTYVLDRKLVTIHSNDRDISKWPFSNNFEITLPEAITNVDSMRLSEVKLPSNYYSFSNELQNTKMAFSLIAINDHWPAPYKQPLTDAANSSYMFLVEIQSGFYTPDQLASELTYKMNKSVSDYLGVSGAYDKFVVFHDEVGMKFRFGNSVDSFVLRFDERMAYVVSQCEQANAWDRYTDWGLGSYLGFDKKASYYSVPPTGANETTVGWTTPATVWLPAPSPPFTGTPYLVIAPMVYKLLGESTVYMEVDRYNHIDELVPFPQNTNGLYNNDYNGSVNSAFAKIPLTSVPYSQVFESMNSNIISSTHFSPPLERVQKLKFRFRNHLGSLMDFQDFPFNFTIEFNCLRNEIGKQYSIRVPTVYSF
jgi:hypothetical protein